MPIILRSTAERLPYVHDGVTIYYHRLTYTERAEVVHLAQARGQVDMLYAWFEAAKRAIDGWDDHVVDADLHPVPVPGGRDSEAREKDAALSPHDDQRQQIAAIVSQFPPLLIEQIGILALQDTPDFLLDAWRTRWPESSALPIDAQAMNLPVSIVAPSAPPIP